MTLSWLFSFADLPQHQLQRRSSFKLKIRATLPFGQQLKMRSSQLKSKITSISNPRGRGVLNLCNKTSKLCKCGEKTGRSIFSEL